MQAKDITIGMTLVPVRGKSLDSASLWDLERATERLTVIGGKEKRLALVPARFSSYGDDREVDGWLVTAKSTGSGDTYRAIAKGTNPRKSASHEPERIIPDTFVLTSGRGLYTVAEVEARMVVLRAAKVASDASKDREQARQVAFGEAVTADPALLDTLRSIGVTVQGATRESWEPTDRPLAVRRITLTINTVEQYAALSALLAAEPTR